MYEREQERFRTADAQVVGVSTDSRYSNAAWAAQLGGFSFALLSDFYPHGKVAELYGVLNPRGMPERAIIVIDKAGIVRYVDVHKLVEAPDPDVLFEELGKLR